jgi:putative flavoprotein involved in K+ transport
MTSASKLGPTLEALHNGSLGGMAAGARLDAEIAAGFALDAKRQAEDAMKKRAIHTAATYDDFRNLVAEGITVYGRAAEYVDGVLSFADDLAANIAEGDRFYLELLDDADAYAERNGLDLPEEPDARTLGPLPECITTPIRELDLVGEGITSIIWATGFRTDYGWLQVDAFDEQGKPAHRRGVSTEPGVYFLGLPWLSRRGSSFIWGVWSDAGYVADHIDGQRMYLSYRS